MTATQRAQDAPDVRGGTEGRAKPRGRPEGTGVAWGGRGKWQEEFL